MEIRIDADAVAGKTYDFWSTSVMPVQDAFLKRNLYASIREEHPFARYMNCVRFLGGIQNNKDDFYRGEDPEGEAICDFSLGLAVIQGILACNFEPRIVLDNIPAGMCDSVPMHTYGQTMPPQKPKVWASYVRQLMKALINRFGYDRVRSWRFRVGTEPDLYPDHWSASQVQYYQHYDNTVDAITRVIPDADIGPGNILDPMEHPRAKYPHVRWGAELIDHGFGGMNLVTGEKGTRMCYFATSWYGHVGLNNNRFDDAISELRRRVVSHGKDSSFPLEVHEFAVLTDEQGRRLYNGDASEWGASWMADIADRIYRLKVHDVYQWATTTYGVANPRTHVLQLLARMVGGERLIVHAPQPDEQEHIGCIAVHKEGLYHLLVYRHRAEREESGEKFLPLRIHGGKFASRDWTVKEAKVIDDRHSGYIRALYEDIKSRGIEPVEHAPNFGADIERRYGAEGRAIFNLYKEKYKELGKLADYLPENKWISTDGDGLELNLKMASHSVLYIVLS